MSLSNVNTKTTIHIRRYFDDSNKNNPIRSGITQARQNFLDLASLSYEILTEYDRLEDKPTRKNTDAMVLATTMVVPAIVYGTIISTKLEPDENAVSVTTNNTTLPENYLPYALTENENLSKLCSMNTQHLTPNINYL